MLASRTKSRMREKSCRIAAASCVGVDPSISNPRSISRERMVASFSAATTTAFNFATTSAGVPAGARNAHQSTKLKPAAPSSATVGMSGN